MEKLVININGQKFTYEIGKDQLFDGLRAECDCVAQMYASGREKKEVAASRHKSPNTVNNQVQWAIEETECRNGRELAFKTACKIIEKLLKDMNVKIIIASFFLMLTIPTIFNQQDLRAVRSQVRITRVVRGRRRNDNSD